MGDRREVRGRGGRWKGGGGEERGRGRGVLMLCMAVGEGEGGGGKGRKEGESEGWNEGAKYVGRKERGKAESWLRAFSSNGVLTPKRCFCCYWSTEPRGEYGSSRVVVGSLGWELVSQADKTF